MNIARVLSLEDHLESLEICPVPERDIGLLVATIVLAVLLFIVIVTIILYFVLIRKYKLHLKWYFFIYYTNTTNIFVIISNNLEPYFYFAGEKMTVITNSMTITAMDLAVTQ